MQNDRIIKLDSLDYRLPTFHIRLFAALIDVIIMCLILYPVTILLYKVFGMYSTIISIENTKVNDIQNLNLSYDFILHYFLIQFILFTIWSFYISIMLSNFGWTLGKRALNCQVISVITGNKLTFIRSVLRVFCYIPSILFFGIGIFMMIFSKKGLSLHDKMSGSIVVYRKSIVI